MFLTQLFQGLSSGPRPALTSENMGSFLAKSTTRVMAGVMILVNSLKASRSTLSPSDVGATGDWPILSGYMGEMTKMTDMI